MLALGNRRPEINGQTFEVCETSKVFQHAFRRLARQQTPVVGHAGTGWG